MFASIHPIVLVGGQSLRFGRDKLREPVGPSGTDWLVDRPVRTLREVFGARVTMVGDCDPEVAARADLQRPDRYPGSGPAGGILAALEQSAGDVFVLAGDLPDITSASVRAILDAASGSDAWVVLGESGGVQPCIGLYRQVVRPLLAERLLAGRRSLHDLVPMERLLLVPIDAGEARNVNTPERLTP
ncbi:MAG: molybdenum cofactor guanylyltransferase [Gemmatimonadaceae bacterium]|nr:molybdenum cofactor guanylyltransferase [Gemmatimonadaceae bacterium]